MVEIKLIYIVSLKYSPIFKSHCYAMGKELKKKGYKIKYVFSIKYQWMLSGEDPDEILFCGESQDLKTIIKDSLNISNLRLLKKSIDEDKPDFVYFHNTHPFFNYYIARKVKNMGGKVINHVHEPYVDEKYHYGWFQRSWLYLFEYIQGLILKKSDRAVLSSKEAWSLFDKRYPSFQGEKIMIPLLYEDYGKNSSKETYQRQYLSFIGPPVSAKWPEKFLEIVESSKSRDLSFLLISRTKIQAKKYYQFDNLKIFQQNEIGDKLMGDLIEKSIMIITPYKTARQSSVALTAFMHGIPVLATNINGLNEFVKHKETGYLVDKNARIEEWIRGIHYIQININTLSKNCRKQFEENFSESNWPKYFNEVFKIAE